MARPEPPFPTPEEAPPPPAAKIKAPSGVIPLLLVIVLSPVLTWAVVHYLLLPELRKELISGPDPATAAAMARASNEAIPATNSYTFEGVVVNLAGTMGTRYLKTTFMVSGSDGSLHTEFESNKARLLDVSLNVLSSLSLADLEEAGAKNIIREKLIQAYNQALGRKVAEQVFFSDFVVQ